MPAIPNSAHCEGLIGRTIDNTIPGGPRSELEFIAVLGQGAYGVVYLARDVLAAPGLPILPPQAASPAPRSRDHPLNPYRQPLYAVKCLNKLGLSARQRDFQEREIALHARASGHPSVVTMHNVIESTSKVYVVLDFCPGGDLFGLIVEEQRFLGDDDKIKRVFLQVVDAVAHSHSLGIFHRDLKPENILATDATGDRVVLADFGLATSEPCSTDFGCGSTFYMSPECHGGLFERLGSYSSAANDVWSLGVVLVNLACGRNPWRQATPEDPTFKAFLRDPAFLNKMLPISPQADAVLRRVFALNPAARMTVAELRSAVERVERFTMTEEELAMATDATKEAARAFVQGDVVVEAVRKAQPVQVVVSGGWDSEAEVSEDDFSLSSPPVSPWTFNARAFVAQPEPATNSATTPSNRKQPPAPLTNLGTHFFTCVEDSTPPQSPDGSDSASDATASQPVTPTNATHQTALVAVAAHDPFAADADTTHHRNSKLGLKHLVVDSCPSSVSFLADWPVFASWAEQGCN